MVFLNKSPGLVAFYLFNFILSFVIKKIPGSIGNVLLVYLSLLFFKKITVSGGILSFMFIFDS